MRIASLFVSTLSFAALPALAGTPLENALAAPDDGPSYKFQLKIDDGDLKAEALVDPSLPEGERLTLISPDETDLDEATAKQLADMKANTTGDNIWCSRFSRNIPGNAKLISESGEAAVYSFQPVGTREDGDMAKAYKHLSGRVTVSKDKPAIIAYEMFAEKPFKPMLVAKVDSFSMKVSCDYAPDGRTYVKDMRLDLSGSAMMQDFAQSERREISNLVPLPETAVGQR